MKDNGIHEHVARERREEERSIQDFGGKTGRKDIT
jgi:hypothetical protein